MDEINELDRIDDIDETLNMDEIEDMDIYIWQYGWTETLGQLTRSIQLFKWMEWIITHHG